MGGGHIQAEIPPSLFLSLSCSLSLPPSILPPSSSLSFSLTPFLSNSLPPSLSNSLTPSLSLPPPPSLLLTHPRTELPQTSDGSFRAAGGSSLGGGPRGQGGQAPEEERDRGKQGETGMKSEWEGDKAWN